MTLDGNALLDQVKTLKQKLRLADSEKLHAYSLFEKKLLAANATGDLVKSQQGCLVMFAINPPPKFLICVSFSNLVLQAVDQLELGRLLSERELLKVCLNFVQNVCIRELSQNYFPCEG